jgi:predicted short-subunit dehydrogenase-like oxidoreductase (DUF2520 family)
MLRGVNKPSIAFVGAGALASAMAVLLHERGYPITDVVSREGVSARKLARRVGANASKVGARAISADVVWLAVPDAEIADCAEALARFGAGMRVALHSSGALPSSVLAPLGVCGAKLASAHPMMTFVAGEPPSLHGVWWALEGDGKAVRVARRIAKDLGSETFEIKAEKKALYHAFGAMLSPMLVSELTAASALGAAAGVPKAKLEGVMRPIVERTLANFFENGGAASFSGPLRRGDVDTIKRHVSALKQTPAEREAYLALVKYAVGALPTNEKQAIMRLLSKK